MKKMLVITCAVVAILLIVTSCSREVKEDVNIVKGKVDKPYYYNDENKERYKAYGNENPDMHENDIIWRVEADLDKGQYADMNLISKEIENDENILVNKHFYFREDYVPAKLVRVQGEKQATSKTAKAFHEMEKDANRDNIALNIRSGYRSINLQEKYYNNYFSVHGREQADKYSARAKSSEHHTGRALDIVSDDWSFDNFENTESCKWLHKNANKYGFILRYQKDIIDITGYEYEPWHITYVGKKVAEKFRNGEVKSLEEYWVKYVKYSPEGK